MTYPSASFQPKVEQAPQIGTAWMGQHVVIIRCDYINNITLSIHTSNHAPTEPATQNGAETLSRFLSIGYHLISAVPLVNNQVQYILTRR